MDANMLQQALEAVSWLQSNANVLGNVQSFQAGSSSAWSSKTAAEQAVVPQSEERSSRDCPTPTALSRDIGSLDAELSSILSDSGEYSKFNV